MKEPSRIEILEPRIAPASVSVTYTDDGGDLVKITASKPGKVAPTLDLADLGFANGIPTASSGNSHSPTPASTARASLSRRRKNPAATG